MSQLEFGSVAWVRLGQAWWPGTIYSLEKCPPEFVKTVRKPPLAVVKFFHENEFQDIHKEEHIYPYSCERKVEFIKRGLYINKNQSHGDVNLLKKFESDVTTAEKLTGGDMNILQTLGEVLGKRRIDYSDLGFGQPKAKKKKEEGSKRGTDIGQAVVYKRSGLKNRGNGKVQRVVIEHKVRILEQPKRETIEESGNASSWFKCYVCGFTCTRINVIVWHNKAHLNKVYDFDTGIKVPGRKRRKPGMSKANKDTKKKGKSPKAKTTVDHSHTNGEVLDVSKEGNNTQELLQDWEDEEEEVPGTSGTANGRVALSGGLDNNNSDDGYSDDDGYPPPQPDHERRPMPKPADINSAFDALLATTPSAVGNSHNNQMSKYISNDSDSDCSDWEKYYDRDASSDVEEETTQESDDKSDDGFAKSNGVKSERDGEKQMDKKDDSNYVAQESSLDSSELKPEPKEEMPKDETLEVVKSEEKEGKEDFRSESISSNSEDFKPSVEDVIEKEVKQEEKLPQPVSQKSSTDIYEYVDEFGESPQEPYEPPKKPYESLQKYRLLQESYKSSQTSSRRYSKESLPEDRHSLIYSDSEHEEEIEKEPKKEKSPSVPLEKPESPEELPDYESEEEVQTTNQVKPEYLESHDTDELHVSKNEGREDEREDSERTGYCHQSEIYHEEQKIKKRTSEPVQGDLYGEEMPSHRHDEDERHVESSTFNKPWESGHSPSLGYHHGYGSGMSDMYYQSRPDHRNVREEQKEGNHSRSEDAQISHPRRSDEGQDQNVYDSHKAAYSSVHSRGESSHTQQDSLRDSESSLVSEEAERYDSSNNSPYSGESVPRKEPHIPVPSREPEQGQVANEPTRDIEEFMRDTDKLTQNINMLAENIDVRSANAAAIRERVRRSFSDYDEQPVKEEEDMPQVLNLSTQDRSTRESTEKYSQDAHSSYGRSGASSDTMYQSKSAEHSASSSSGNSYMLVPVDAHGNTVPTESTSNLSEGSGNLIAVEATLDDGTTRAIYLDRSQLDPDVDLNNLMLHIDTSGQEHIIIPCSNSSEASNQELFAYEAQNQHAADTSPAESQAYRYTGHESSDASQSYQSDNQHYQVTYSGDYDERHRKGEEEHL